MTKTKGTKKLTINIKNRIFAKLNRRTLNKNFILHMLALNVLLNS